MPREFKLPDLGEGIHEGEILKVFVSEGDAVKEDETILEVETDKAAVEVPSPFGGTVSEVHVQEGDLVEVGDVLFTYEGDGDAGGETGSDAAEESGQESEGQAREEKAPEASAEEEEKQKEKEKKEESDAGKSREGAADRPVPASPATRKLARELDVTLEEVPGSGPAGRVTSQDVRSYAEGEEDGAEQVGKESSEESARKPRQDVTEKEGISPVRPAAIPVPDLPDFSKWGEVERVPLRSVRRATARNMTLSWSQIPHVSHQDEADITELDAMRREYQEEVGTDDLHLTITSFVMKAAVAALKEHPRFNASLDADSQEIILKRYYHLGVAVDTDHGLLVPVIRDVDRKSILDLTRELDDLVVRTRSREVKPEEMRGGTFTITNPGPLGGTGFTPLIKYPEVAILGLAQARQRAVVQGEGEDARVVPRLRLPVILSFDHRVVDGADAARFARTVVRILEDPARLLVRV